MSLAADVEVVARGSQFRAFLGVDFQDGVGLNDSRAMQHQFAPLFHGVNAVRGINRPFSFDRTRNLRFPQKRNGARLDDRPDFGIRRIDRHGVRQCPGREID
jgi:hypothetical protein